MEDVHCHQVEVEEVKDEVLNLDFVNADAYQVGKLQISEALKLKEEGQHVP
jgi:hypothetical protein